MASPEQEELPPDGGVNSPLDGRLVQAMAITTKMHVGPIPPAELLEAYVKIYPGAAKSIFDEAEKNAEHFRQMEREGAKIAARDALLHRLLPFGVLIAFLMADVAIASLAGA